MNITKEYFQNEIMAFREIMGNRDYTIEQVSKALKGLIIVYLRYMENATSKEKQSAEISFAAICLEHDKRLALRIIHNI